MKSDVTSAAVSGTTIENGTAGTGGNIYISGATTFTDCVFNQNATSGTGTQVYNDALVTLEDCTMDTGTIFGDGGVTVDGSSVNSLTLRRGTATLAGAAEVAAMRLDSYTDSGVTTYAALVVDQTFSGAAKITRIAKDYPVYGGQMDALYTSNGDFTGKVYLDAMDADPWLFHDNGALVVGNARTVKGKEITWHKNNAKAALNYGDADMMYPGNHELPLAGGDYVVNVCGLDLNVTGTGTVTFFDTANKNFKDYGSVTVAETVEVANEFETAVDGLTYYMVFPSPGYEDLRRFHPSRQCWYLLLRHLAVR